MRAGMKRGAVLVEGIGIVVVLATLSLGVTMIYDTGGSEPPLTPPFDGCQMAPGGTMLVLDNLTPSQCVFFGPSFQ